MVNNCIQNFLLLSCIWDTVGNYLLQNEKSNDLEALHGALGTEGIQMYIYDDPRLTMAYFMARSNFVACAPKVYIGG